jgi:ABC-type antimicrobial peptide transport system permease subunit
MALGSTTFQAMAQIGRSGAAASLFGMASGLILSLGALRVMRSVIYGVGVYDATTLVTVMLTLAIVTILGIVLPVLKVAKIDPAITLRDE